MNSSSSNNSGSEDDIDLQYNSDSTEEFNNIENDCGVFKEKVTNAEILLSIPDGVGSKSYKLLYSLTDMGMSKTLVNAKIFGPRSGKKTTKEAF